MVFSWKVKKKMNFCMNTFIFFYLMSYCINLNKIYPTCWLTDKIKFISFSDKPKSGKMCYILGLIFFSIQHIWLMHFFKFLFMDFVKQFICVPIYILFIFYFFTFFQVLMSRNLQPKLWWYSPKGSTWMLSKTEEEGLLKLLR